MDAGKRLTDYEKGQIDARRTNGDIFSDTADALDRVKKCNYSLRQWKYRSIKEYRTDLNPIENIWRQMVRVIYVENKTYRTVDELKQAILAACNQLSFQIFQNHVNSMPDLIFQVINRNGGVTDY